ncbi:protein of unknown function [Kyrpidia spormannii]|uniref:Uncharacterized protein n=1 Tax=Kyrpidia spormannii TaxID=2055160 RepID=A0A6F9E2C8_9BACL|nr:protein of unknown function [Kyrpidia spormannii]
MKRMIAHDGQRRRLALKKPPTTLVEGPGRVGRPVSQPHSLTFTVFRRTFRPHMEARFFCRAATFTGISPL